MTPFRPLFRTVRADGAVYSLTFANDGTWTILLDQALIETGPTADCGVEKAVEKFTALALAIAPQQSRLARAS
ncbi:MAG TPA: hypothetical protein VGR35_03150 [Tepidisphaeraceae bacterium]|nr:hypothetical protein [Tepidisphaeraceae bacterium]